MAPPDDPDEGKPSDGDGNPGHVGFRPTINDRARRLKVLESFSHMYRPTPGDLAHMQYLGEAIERVSTANPKDVQQIAASQLERKRCSATLWKFALTHGGR
jgi:hypothetical protein